MKGQLLKLCRRLSKFSLEQIVLISELEETQVLSILKEFVSEGKLLESEGQYCYCKKVSVMQKSSILRYYTSSVVDTVIRCFCLDIPCYKTYQLLAIGETQTNKLYSIFREELFKKQTIKLKSFYNQKPQIARNRMFFDAEFQLLLIMIYQKKKN